MQDDRKGRIIVYQTRYKYNHESREREIMTRRELNVHRKYLTFQTRIRVFLKLTQPSIANHLFNFS